MADLAPILRVVAAGLELPNPVGLASGTCGYGRELDGLVDWRCVGAIFTKGISLEPRAGHPPPRIWETPSGMLNAIGLENVGLEAFVGDKMPYLAAWRKRHGGRVVVNIYGTEDAHYAALARRLDEVEGVDGVEINLSCPNVTAGGIEFGRDPALCEKVVRAVRETTQKAVLVKLSPAVPSGEMARACEAAGADGIVCTNTMPALCIDIETRRARLSAGGGGLSGPALRPISVRATRDAALATKLPIWGVGGVASAEHAIEFMLAGATAVQVGTATFRDPNTAARICEGIEAYLRRVGAKSISEIVGAVVA